MKRPSRAISCVLVVSLFGAACAAKVHQHATGTQVRSALGTSRTPSTEANITQLTSNILERSQFSHHPLDAELAGRFLDGYLDALDGAHALFLQSDLKEFSAYREALAQATRTAGDTRAARAILTRFLARLEQRQQYVTGLLNTEPFDFAGNDRYSFDRERAPRPSDLSAAQALWREQLRAEYLAEKLNGAQHEQIVASLGHRYESQLQAMKTLKSDELLEVYLNALAHVYDPHSDYLGHEQMESFAMAMNLSLFGIGATLESVDGYCEVRELVPGGPAALSGLLQPGDRIVSVAQAGKAPVDVTGIPLSRTVELIRGAKGTAVELTVRAAGATAGAVPKVVTLVRDKIQLADQEVSARIVDLANPDGSTLRLGVLELPSFYGDVGDSGAELKRSVTADVARLLSKLKAEQVQGLVVDLRSNGGGSLNEAVSLTGLFIHQGPVVQTRGPAGDIEVDSDRDPAEQYDGPLIVLTSRLSASASEIFAGALQDYGRAVVVGDSSTFGKGTVQSVLPLAPVMDANGLSHGYDPGALKVTIRKFYRPDGASTQLRGVASDIVLPSATDLNDFSESALKEPLPWDAVPAAPHERLSFVAPYLSRLRARSANRVSADKAFKYLSEDAARLKKSFADKSVSLNENERRDEMTKDKARQTQRELEAQSDSVAAPPSFEITLKNVDTRGLPAPVPFGVTRSARQVPSEVGATVHESRAPQRDAILDESLRILADYAEALHGAKGLQNPGAP